MAELPAADLALLESLRAQTLEQWRPLVGDPGGRAALLDFPNHDNVGDALIWVGQRWYLRRLGVRVRYVSDLRKLDPAELRRRVPQGPVLLTGGGSFGDLYDDYQRFREAVVAEFTDRRVVQLPQSVWFRSPERAARANAVFSRHPDFTLVVRERASLQRCREQLPDVRVELSHDAAFGAGPLRRRPPRTDVVALVRRDVESAGSPPWPDDVHPEVVDWGLGGARAALDQALHAPGWAARRYGPPLASRLHPLVRLSFEAMARLNVSSGTALLSAGRLVVTDRLHAHVMCSLMGVPHIALDNTYGKIAAVADHSSRGFSSAAFSTPERLAEDLDHHRGGPGALGQGPPLTTGWWRRAPSPGSARG